MDMSSQSTIFSWKTQDLKIFQKLYNSNSYSVEIIRELDKTL